MPRFIQAHTLTFYPPANLNRDDLGRPKTALIGGHARLRISSQCLKRAWRTSEVFQQALAGNLGTRTKRLAREVVLPILEEAGINEAKARDWAVQIAHSFAKVEKGKVDTQQLVHFSPAEIEAVRALTQTLAEEKRAPEADELKQLAKAGRAVDIAMFGRMLADHPVGNIDAAVQVAHAFTINRVELEDDFFTAVDDLNRHEDTGAGHVDEAWFGSGVFYSYLCINRERLDANLDGDTALAGRAVEALIRAAATVSPGGKQNSFAALAHAGYMLVERGDAQPRNLALAFSQPIRPHAGAELLEGGIEKLEALRAKMDTAFEIENDSMVFNPTAGQGTLGGLAAFAAGA